jgi:exonuclease V
LDLQSQDQADAKAAVKKEPPPSPPPSPPRKIYITDVKTRESDRLPSGAAIRPSKIQLFLYHRFLCELASGNFCFDVVFQRYQVNEYEPFSDDFFVEMQSDPLFVELTTEYNNTLYEFVRILKREVALTFPHGAASIGDVVAVEYRQRPRGDEEGGRCIGTNVIPVDEGVLDRYLANYLAWWRGARAPVGVDIEEAALKCGYCEFVDDCDWRQKMDEERMKKARAKMAAARGQKS